MISELKYHDSFLILTLIEEYSYFNIMLLSLFVSIYYLYSIYINLLFNQEIFMIQNKKYDFKFNNLI